MPHDLERCGPAPHCAKALWQIHDKARDGGRLEEATRPKSIDGFESQRVRFRGPIRCFATTPLPTAGSRWLPRDLAQQRFGAALGNLNSVDVSRRVDAYTPRNPGHRFDPGPRQYPQSAPRNNTH